MPVTIDRDPPEAIRSALSQGIAGFNRDTIPDLEAPNRDRAPMGGEVPSPVSPPSGCSFHPRCPLAFDRCRAERPARHASCHDGRVACFAAAEDAPGPVIPTARA